MKPIFAAVPLRALADQGLSGLDLRTLMAVAAHDRLGVNGRGCYAGQVRIARMVRSDKTRVSKSLTRLISRGYISLDRQSEKRRQNLRVLYTDADASTMTPGAAGDSFDALPGIEIAEELENALVAVPVAQNDSWPIGQPFRPAKNGEIVDHLANSKAEIVDRSKLQAAEIIGRLDTNISSERLINTVETEEILVKRRQAEKGRPAGNVDASAFLDGLAHRLATGKQLVHPSVIVRLEALTRDGSLPDDQHERAVAILDTIHRNHRVPRRRGA
jgi:hypothetical protein